MIYLKIIFYATVIVLFSNCSSKQEQALDVEKISVDYSQKNNKRIDLSTNYFNNRKIVSLETNKESLISQINRLIIFENRFYIFDYNTKSIFIFNSDGGFVKKIRNIGRGPGQYIQISDFTINTKSKEIILLCDIPYRLIYYNLNGYFLRQEAQRQHNQYISTNDTSIIYVNPIQRNGKYIGIKKENKTKNYLPVEDYIIGKDYYSRRPNLIRSNDGIYFFKVYDNKIYRVSNNGITPAYQFDYGEKGFPLEYVKNHTPEEVGDFDVKNKLITRINDFRSYDNHLVFSTYHYFRIGIYNKITQNTHLFVALKDPDIGLYLSDMIGYDGVGDDVMFKVESSYFIQNVKNENPEVQSLLNKLDYNSNPLLIMYDFKQ